MRIALFILIAICWVNPALSIDNGKGITPPLGWRSWNLYGADVNQDLIEKQMDGIVSRKRLVDGVPTSLYDLGYRDVGLDDNWQKCGSYGPNKYTYHDDLGQPVINHDLFPDFKSMTDYAHSKNLTAGWYGNNCICSDHCSDVSCYIGDVNAAVAYGFDSIKLDGCGAQGDLQLWSDLFNKTGKPILIENCHWGGTVPNATWCPWNYFRTSGDIRASYASVILNLLTTVEFAKDGLSKPGCWAYPDMLEVGCAHGPGGASDPGLTFTEAQSHFGAWCVVSSPLILSHDTNNDTISDAIWPIISNKEAIAVNQAWAGESGTVFASSSYTITLELPVDETPKVGQPEWYKPVSKGEVQVEGWQQWYKPVSATSTAVLVMNHGDAAAIDVAFQSVPTFAGKGYTRFTLRDIWNHRDLGTFTSYTVNLVSRQSAFFIVTPSN